MSANMKPVRFCGEIAEGYFCDENGNVFSTKRKNVHKLIIRPGTNHNPYPKVSLSINGKTKCPNIHRVVCETFHPTPIPKILTDKQWDEILEETRDIIIKHISSPDRFQVNHIDHDGDNFHPSNLEWTTTRENQQAFQNFRKNSLHS